MQVNSGCFAQLAARREQQADRWSGRFSELLRKRVVSLAATPGNEYGLSIPPLPFADDADKAVRFCTERIEAAGAVANVLFDVSALDAVNCAAWLVHFLGRMPPSVSLSIAAEHPAMPALVRAAGSRRIIVRFAGQLDRRAWGLMVASSHARANIQPVPALAGRTLSGLHRPEQGLCAMPVSLFETGPDTAWCMLDIDASRLGQPSQLRRQLAASLRLADNLLDEIVWPRPALQLDALLNRRVGIHINNLDALLRLNGFRDNNTHAFLWLRRWLQFVRHCLLHESMLLARARGPFPELGANELINELAPHYGSEHAQRLLRGRFLRHRHLLSLSPCALFPQEFAQQDEQHYLNFVPVIACADVISMRGPDPRTHLSMQGWDELLRLTAALASAPPAIPHNRWS